MSNDSTIELPKAHLETARRELDKLPILGPAIWLFSRDDTRRFTFIADLDWRLMPPLVLDQCRLYSREGLPWSFVTWAFVSDVVHQRLLVGPPIIAPAEWKSGEHLWLIDVVSPFGNSLDVAKDAIHAISPGKSGHCWIADPTGQPKLVAVTPNN